MGFCTIIFTLFICALSGANALERSVYISTNGVNDDAYYDINILSSRQKRDLPSLEHNESTNTTVPEVQTTPTTLSSNTTLTNDSKSSLPDVVSGISNVTEANTTASVPLVTPSEPVTTQIPLLGVNGTGIRKYAVPNLTNQPKVSDPIKPDDDAFNMTEIFRETPELIKAEHNLTNITFDNHTYYNSSFIGDLQYFNEHWTNITKGKADIHAILSNSHRRATTLMLSFEFPFYGQPLRNITVATGGFIYMGDHVHSWLAATQYVAPLMANFDTRITNDSFVKLYDDGTKFTAIWENVALQETRNQSFTFAVTLMKNGDIIFAYKDVPIQIKDINDKQHPVKVGISDAYLTDKIMFYVRRKTIYEYHRVSFMKYEIKSNTILKLQALPTCLQYNTCESCINNNTTFDCSWCSQIQRCSSGIDRNRQDWMMRNCDKLSLSNSSQCPAPTKKSTLYNETTAYVTDQGSNPYHDTVVRTDLPVVRKSQVETIPPQPVAPSISPSVAPSAAPSIPSVGAKVHEEPQSSSVGGVVAVFLTVALISTFGAWILYAFKNPHTRSGQLLIKYRPSQWSWKRGEARYTAATIHM